MPTVLVMNGPNLNLLGTREPAQYGASTLDDVEKLCRTVGDDLGLDIDFLQSNHEGVLIDRIHAAGAERRSGRLLGVVINPGAYAHSSIALHDAIKGVDLPVIELHVSNVHRREAFRHHSYVSSVAIGVIVGLGIQGYEWAIRALATEGEHP